MRTTCALVAALVSLFPSLGADIPVAPGKGAISAAAAAARADDVLVLSEGEY